MIRMTGVFIVLVAGTFIVTFQQSSDTWTALNAAGIVAAVGLIVIVTGVLRRETSKTFRRSMSVMTAVIILGTGFHWFMMYRTSRWQYNSLHLIHKVIQHASAVDLLSTRGRTTLIEYYGQRVSRQSLGEFFRSRTTYVNADSGIIEVNTDMESKIIVESISDSEVVLIAQSTIRVDGEDPAFLNFDGQTGAVQDRLRITKRGIVYELQN